VLLHPHGDARLHPVSYPFDAEIVRVKAENNPPSPYWRQRYTRDEGALPLVPWIGRVGIRFALYSPDEALVCGRSIPFTDIAFGEPIEGNRRKMAARKDIHEFALARCDFAAGPHTRLDFSPLTNAVVYLMWDSTYNQWVFDDIAVGSADWSFTAGIDRITYAIASQQEVQARCPPARCSTACSPRSSRWGADLGPPSMCGGRVYFWRPGATAASAVTLRLA